MIVLAISKARDTQIGRKTATRCGHNLTVWQCLSLASLSRHLGVASTYTFSARCRLPSVLGVQRLINTYVYLLISLNAESERALLRFCLILCVDVE